MKIVVEPHPDKREWLDIIIDGEWWKSIHLSLFGRRSAFPSQIDSWEKWKEVFDEAEYRCVKNYVLRRLSMQSYYSIQLIKLLNERLVSDHVIDRVIQECVAWGYLNDQAWLESFMRTHRKRHSMRAITLKLRAKGVSSSTIEELMESWHDPEEDERAIQKILRTRYAKRDLQDFKERQKVMAALARKGYSFELIRSALDTFKT